MTNDAADTSPERLTDADEIQVGATSAKFTTSMLITMFATVPLEILLTATLGLRDGRLGSGYGIFLALPALMVYIAVWMLLIKAAQALLLRRYCGASSAPGGWRAFLPPYWQYRGHGHNRTEFPPFFSHSSGARLSRRQLALVIAVFPVLSLVAIVAAIIAVYTLRLDYVWMIGVTAGLGGSFAFVGPLLRVLRLPRDASAELVSDASVVKLRGAGN